MAASFVLRVLTHRVTLFIGVVCAIVFVTVTVWEKQHRQILEHDEYRLDRDQIVVSGNTPQLVNDLQQHVSAKFKNCSSLDTRLVAKVASYVKSHPLVGKTSIEKKAKQLSVQVDFRQPVALVELGNRLIPLDSESVVFDGKPFRNRSPDEFLRITINQPNQDQLKIWNPWPDARVQKAALICQDLNAVWKEFELYRVVTYWRPGQAASQADTFELWTKYENGGRIIWSDAASETHVAASIKIDAIRAYIQQHGRLPNSDRVENWMCAPEKPSFKSQINSANKQTGQP